METLFIEVFGNSIARLYGNIKCRSAWKESSVHTLLKWAENAIFVYVKRIKFINNFEKEKSVFKVHFNQ